MLNIGDVVDGKYKVILRNLKMPIIAQNAKISNTENVHQ